MHMTHERARMDYSGITHIHHFFLPRAAQAMAIYGKRRRRIRMPASRLSAVHGGTGDLGLFDV